VTLWISVGIALYCLWFLAMLLIPAFRHLSNEIWGHYLLSILRVGWPYVLIAAVYRVISDGSLADIVRAAVGR
jgi:hypothetical protein